MNDPFTQSLNTHNINTNSNNTNINIFLTAQNQETNSFANQYRSADIKDGKLVPKASFIH